VFGVVSLAVCATESVGLTVSYSPIRGGTDGARLTELGLPCPNLGTGGYAFHGPFEHITKEGMEKATAVIVEMVRLASLKTAKEIFGA
jgi:tripeptide aminopeptidase